MKDVKKLKDKERKIVEQQLHAITSEIVAYVKQFPRPVMVTEEIRDNFEKSKELNRRFHSLPFRKAAGNNNVQSYAWRNRGRHLPKEEVKNTSKTAIACCSGKMEGNSDARNAGACLQPGFKRMHKYSHALTRGMVWGGLAFEPAGKRGVKPSLTPEAPPLKAGEAHI